MTHIDSLHPAVALIAALLLVVGASLTLIGNIGMLRLRSFYQRLHAPTLGTSWGTAATVIASAVVFSALGSRVAIHELAIGVFVMLTTPIGLLILGRAAYRRDPPVLNGGEWKQDDEPPKP